MWRLIWWDLSDVLELIWMTWIYIWNISDGCPTHYVRSHSLLLVAWGLWRHVYPQGCLDLSYISVYVYFFPRFSKNSTKSNCPTNWRLQRDFLWYYLTTDVDIPTVEPRRECRFDGGIALEALLHLQMQMEGGSRPLPGKRVDGNDVLDTVSDIWPFMTKMIYCLYHCIYLVSFCI